MPPFHPALLRRAALALLLAAAGCGADADRRADAAAAATELGDVEPVATPAGPASGSPRFSAGRDGRLYLSWLERVDGARHALRLSEIAGGTAGAARTVVERENFFVNWADVPSVAEHPDGRLAAHWLERTGSGTYAYGVRVALSADGGRSWGPPLTPHRDDSDTEHGFLSFFPADARLGAVWLDGRNFAGGAGHGAGHDDAPGAEMMLLHTTLDADGALGAEQPLDTRVCDCCPTDAAVAAAGAVVVYRDRSTEEIRDIAIVRRVDGRWTEPRLVHADGWKIAGCPVNGPAVAAAGERVAVAWFTAAQDTARVRLAFSDDGGAGFGTPVRVDDGDPVGRVDVLLLDDGSALVAWLERTADAAEVRVRRVARDGRLGTARTIAASDAVRASGFPRIARSGDVVWFAWTVPGGAEGGRVELARARLGPG